jgi:pyruvate/2-oxoglutarate dehydrogenase complex dihydrolipoamide acyltransferase (E2) component
VSVIHEIFAPKENADDILLVSKKYFNTKDKISKNDELIDLETSKTAIIIDSPVNGYVEYLVEPGESIGVGDIIIRIHSEISSIISEINSKDKVNVDNAVFESQLVSRKAQSYIDKNKIDISGINKLFICLDDLTGESLSKPLKIIDSDYSSKVNSMDANLPVTIKSLSLAKKIEISALTYVQSSSLISTIFYNVDDANLRRSDNLIIKSAGSFLPIITTKVSKLLRKYPALNSYYEDDSIMEYCDVNIGVALDIDDGLKVYTIKNSDKLTYEELEMEISRGIYKYFRKELATNDIKGSTFTITDLSSLGVSGFVPLVNYKQSAILGVSSLDAKLNRFTLSLSFDHRVTEGKIASQFLYDLTKAIKNSQN